MAWKVPSDGVAWLMAEQDMDVEALQAMQDVIWQAHRPLCWRRGWTRWHRNF